MSAKTVHVSGEVASPNQVEALTVYLQAARYENTGAAIAIALIISTLVLAPLVVDRKQPLKAPKRKCLIMATKTARRVALMSIHPRYAHAILDGRKTVEFRKHPLAPDVSHVVVYSTAPDQKVLGYFEIDKQVELSPEALWEQCGDQGIIEKDRFFSYYEGRETGVGILVKQVFRCEQPRSLSDIGVKTPPQNFQYLSEEALQVLARKAPLA